MPAYPELAFPKDYVQQLLDNGRVLEKDLLDKVSRMAPGHCPRECPRCANILFFPQNADWKVMTLSEQSVEPYQPPLKFVSGIWNSELNATIRAEKSSTRLGGYCRFPIV